MSPINILSLSTSGWAYPYWTSRQFLMFELARHANVLYATERPDIRDVGSWRGRSNAQSLPFPAPEGLQVVTARWPRTFRYPALDRVFSKAYTARLQRRLDGGAPAQRVVYAWHPSFLPVIRALSYDVLIYHPYDMFRHFTDAAEEIAGKEEALCALADAVVTPHKRVAEVLRHPASHVINNGVFLPAFPDFRHVTVAGPVRSAGKPVIGYLGAINDKIDFPLLLEVFRSRPQWQLVMIGFEGPGAWRESEVYREIRSLDNVHLMNGVPIDQVAPYIAGFDVGVIPYSMTGWAQFSESPLKLYQYWAMGVPVVCSPLPNVAPVRNALEIGRSAAEWDSAIERQLSAGANPEDRVALRRRAEENGWAKKAEEVMSIIMRSSDAFR